MLHHAPRGPLTWWIFEPRDILAVVCTNGHRSTVQHYVQADGSLVAPAGQLGSMHCGTCNESLPLQLDEWPIGSTYQGPRPEMLPPLSTCAACGKQDRFLGGWGLCGRYVGLVCPACFGAAVGP
jgi:hypothetical protein